MTLDREMNHHLPRMLTLPSLSGRWPVRRKAALIEAVRGGWLAIDEACQRYNRSVDEFVAWERDMDRYGIHGLRTTRYQIYRDTEERRGEAVLYPPPPPK